MCLKTIVNFAILGWDTIMQIMPEVFIIGCIYEPPAYRDLMRAEGLKHIPIFWKVHKYSLK